MTIVNNDKVQKLIIVWGPKIACSQV